MKKILIITLFVSMFFQITSFAEPMDRYKGFGDVFNETIGTSVEEIEYGMICFPDTGVNRASNIEENDLKKLIELYADAEGECVTAPFGTAFDGLPDSDEDYPYFYIGVSARLPEDRSTWLKSVRMLQLCFGGEYGGAAVYGGWGRIGSTYGGEYRDSMPYNFVWYKPCGEAAEAINAFAEELCNKYKPVAKPFGDYEGTGDETYFDGYDGTWDTKLMLPVCFTAEGCSEWAYDILHGAAKDGLIPYNFGGNYKEPITRREFCVLASNILNMTPQREYADLFENPSGYTLLAAKAAEIGADIESISYADVEPSDESIKYLSALGIVNGVGNEMFDPEGLITREQICTIFMRMFELYPGFANALSDKASAAEPYSDDSAVSEWARDGVYAMTRYGIVNGMGNGAFEPQSSCSAEQAVVMFSRLPKKAFGIKWVV